MVGNLTNLTDARPDYPSAVVLLYGAVDPGIQTYGELKRSPNAKVAHIPDDRWPSYLGQSSSHVRGELSKYSELPFKGAACFSDRDYPRFLELTRAVLPFDPLLRLAIELSLNKGELYDRLKTRAVPVGAFVRTSNIHEVAEAITALRQRAEKIILKPSVSTGSAGVYMSSIDEPSQIAADNFFARLPASIKANDYLVMEHIGRDDGGCSEFCVDGLRVGGYLVAHVVHEKVRQSRGGAFRDLTMVTPPIDSHLKQSHEEIKRLVISILVAMECPNTTFHIEFRVTADGEFIPIDIALRPGGGFLAESTRARTGTDLRLEHLLIQTAQAPFLSAQTSRSPSVAIGAFYWKHRDGAVLDSAAVLHVHNALASNPSVLKYHLLTELTDSEYVRPDAGLSLCVAAGDSAGALKSIRSLALACGFE